MKKTIVFLIAFFVIAGTVFSQKMTTEEFMKKYYEKTGLDKYKDLKTLTIEGEMQILNDNYPFRMQYKAPDKYRYKERFKSDYTFKIMNGKDIKTIVKGGRKVDPNQMEIDIMLNIVNFMEGFISGYKSNDFKIEVLGIDTLKKLNPYGKAKQVVPANVQTTMTKIDSLYMATVYKIKVSTPTAKEFIMKVDTTTMNILWSSGNPFVYADIAPIRFNLYEKFEGFSFPVHMNILSEFTPITIRISSIKLNEEMPDSYFKIDSPENQVIDESAPAVNNDNTNDKDIKKIEKNTKKKSKK